MTDRTLVVQRRFNSAYLDTENPSPTTWAPLTDEEVDIEACTRTCECLSCTYLRGRYEEFEWRDRYWERQDEERRRKLREGLEATPHADLLEHVYHDYADRSELPEWMADEQPVS